jgi:hypothetical protein
MRTRASSKYFFVEEQSLELAASITAVALAKTNPTFAANQYSEVEESDY